MVEEKSKTFQEDKFELRKANFPIERLVFEWKIIFPYYGSKLMSESFHINKCVYYERIQDSELSLPIFVYDLNSMQLLENYPGSQLYFEIIFGGDRKTHSNLII